MYGQTERDKLKHVYRIYCSHVSFLKFTGQQLCEFHMYANMYILPNIIYIYIYIFIYSKDNRISLLINYI